MSESASTDQRQRLARFVEPDCPESRIAGIWSGVAGKLPVQPARGRMRWALGAALAVVGVVVFGLLRWLPPDAGTRSASLLEGAVFETRSDSLNMELGDGSAMRLGSQSRVEVLGSSHDNVELALRRGRIECDVKPRKQGRFIVKADGVEVRVVGTLFSVATSRDEKTRRVEVSVERGVVEVRAGGEVARVSAGNSWSRVTSTQPAPRRAEPAAPQPSLAREPERSTATSVNSKPEPATAKELLERANELRREGRVAQAARTYETLLAKHSGDGRAGLAAFELGKLRMDRLGDMAGAISALERAVALAPGSGFREDALARLVTANRKAGNLAGCRRAQKRYLTSFPSGVHHKAVLGQCGSD